MVVLAAFRCECDQGVPAKKRSPLSENYAGQCFDDDGFSFGVHLPCVIMDASNGIHLV